MATTQNLRGWTIISLRPQNQHANLRQAAVRRQAQLLSASSFRLQAAGSDDALTRALDCPLRIAVSPAAVRFAAQSAQAKGRRLKGHWLAVGDATAKALRLAGASQVDIAKPQSAAGLLTHPALANIKDLDIGLISAPEGLGLLEKTLPARGAHLHSAHVYRRQAITMSESKRKQLLERQARTACLVTSQAAFGQFWPQFTKAQQKKLHAWHFVASSARLVHYLHSLGLTQVHLAENTRGPALLNALATAAPRK